VFGRTGVDTDAQPFDMGFSSMLPLRRLLLVSVLCKQYRSLKVHCRLRTSVGREVGVVRTLVFSH